MEVIRSYDIARLVLGYLRDNKLDKAAKAFCKTSPYLTEELELLRKGFWPVSLRHDHLPDIIREYCQIQSEVIQFFDSLSERDKEHFPKHGSLLSKVHLLIKVAKGTLEGKSESGPGGKRKKTVSEDTSASLEATQEKDLPGYSPPISKRRKISSSFLCLANHRSRNSEFSSDDESISNRSPESNSSELDTNISKAKLQSKKKSTEQSVAQENVSNADAETKTDLPIPTFPVISEALLENTEFQNKLVENINKVLTSGPPTTDKSTLVRKNSNSDHASEEMRTQFEEMIKNILDETEKDPTFNELVENIVLSNNSNETKVSTNTQSTQCSPPHATSLPVMTPETNAEATIKDRLRPRKSNTSCVEMRKESNNDTKLTTPCRLVQSEDNLKSGSSVGDNSMSLSKLIMLNPNDTMTTSTPLISDSLLASSGSQLLNQLGDNIFIDMSTGQSIPFFVTNNMNTIFLDGSSNTMAGENLQLGKIIDSQNLETMKFIPQESLCLPPIKPPDNPVVTVTILNNENPPMEGRPGKIKKSVQSEVPTTHQDAPENLEKGTCVLPEKSALTAKEKPSLNSTQKNLTETTEQNVLVTSENDVKAPCENIPDASIATTASKTTEFVNSTGTREKLTPALSAINKELNRSLSTPRRRSSHVRVLNFSTPPESKAETILSSTKPLKSETVATTSESHPHVSTSRSTVPAVTVSEAATVTNESSSSSSINEFAKTTTDVTVIHQSISETPKRKSVGRKSCARILSRSCSEEDTLSQMPAEKIVEKGNKPAKKAIVPSKAKPASKLASKPQKRKPRKVVKPASPVKHEKPPPADPMEAWTRLRSIPTGQWDQHLREVCAIEEATNPPPPTVKKRKPRGKVNQKQVKVASPSQPRQEACDVDTSNSQHGTEAPQSAGKKSAKKALIEFKIATPIKTGKSPGKLKTKLVEITREKVSESASTASKVSAAKVLSADDSQNTLSDSKSGNAQNKPGSAQDILNSRTNNIGLLLDTPYKIDATSIPITPRFLVPDTNTPMIRMAAFQGQISICKNPDLPTPNYAITPGAGLTSLDKDTPKSGYVSNYPTDYSSGSSYYKPDESEELDKHFDTMMAERRRKAKEKLISKPLTNPSNESMEAREISQEESSNQTVITAINTSEKVLQVGECSKISEKSTQSKKFGKRKSSSRASCFSEDHDESNSTRRSSSSSSSNSSESNTSSSDSESISSAGNTDDENISWTDPETHAEKSDHEDSNKTHTSFNDEENPTCKLITPKKQVEQIVHKDVSTKIDKKLEDVVDKIKNKAKVRTMRTKQIESLEEKRLRVKDKLEKDFAVIENRRPCAVTSKKPKPKILPPFVRNQKTKIIKTPPKEEEKETPRTKIEMLTALNLSQKGNEILSQPAVCTSPSDIFEGHEFPKLRVDEDSKDSAETMEVRNAAYVLTKLSKGSIDSSKLDHISFDILAMKNEQLTKVSASIARKGRPKKLKLQEPTENQAVYAPHKPVTRGDSKMNLKLESTLKSSNESPTSPEVLLITETSITASTSRPQINLSEVLVCNDPRESCPDVMTKAEKVDSLSEQEEEEEEDEDPYEACEMVSVNENDPNRYLHLTYDPPRTGRKVCPSSKGNGDLLSSIMNIFINGAPHQIVVVDESELFTQVPSNKTPKQTIRRDDKRPAALPKKRQKLSYIRKGKFENAEESDPAENPDVARLQPKINIKYKQRAPNKEKGKTKSEATQSAFQKKSPFKVSSELVNKSSPAPNEGSKLDTTSAQQTSPESQASIKNEDIFAVLSLIHGKESDK